MAEAVLFDLATNILKFAGSKTFSEIQLVRGLRDELNSLKGITETVRAVLLDAEKQQWHNNQVKLWLGRLKDVLYDIQDLLDEVATYDLRRKVTPGNKMLKAVCVFFSKSNQLAHRLKVANEIQELRKRLDQIKKDREEFHLETHLSEATLTTARRRTTDSFVRKEEIIGRQIDRQKIIRSLLDSSSGESVSVVSIVGMGGLGKTTLARLAYNDDEMRKCFKLKMWVCVSDVFDEDILIKEILKSAQDECQGDPELMRNLHDIENKSKDQLQRLLRKVLDGKKYLLVLDDLWNENRERWLELQRLLMGGSRGSKILITTRNQSVVQATDKNSVVHDLHVLSEDESWDLLKKMALGDGKESSYQKLEETGRDIVKKCGGVPLAIKTIGNLLYARKEKEWLYFKEHELSKIDELNPGIMDVLKLSYNHLPSGLKNCFAYCALFPKDYVFDKQTMIQLWMAQGFIESLDEDEKLEDIGDSYVSDLLSRSFLEVEEVDHYTGEVKMFKMHDLMHDLALKVAGNECKMVSHNNSGIGADTRHASFALQLSSLQEVTSLLEETTLRTFLSMKKTPSVQKLSSNEYHGIFSKFRRCRTLVLDNVDFCIPTSLDSRLKHLRFLDVSKNQSIKSLDSITDSLNLQTLKLYECKNLKTFPKDWRKLIKLRYLLIDGCNSLSRLPPLSELPSLRTLILVGLDALQFLHQTRDPKQFHITRPFFPSLQRLSLLNCRNLKGCWGNNSESPFPKVQSVEIRGCPDLHSVPPFPQMEYLSIEGTKILEQQLLDYLNCPSKAAVGSTLVPFSKLKRLHLSSTDLEPSMFETLFQLANNLEFMRLFHCDLRRFSCGMQHLSSLQELDITHCQGLDLSCQEDDGTQWRFLTNLRVLNISNCLDLTTLTEGIQYVTTLQSLKIYQCLSFENLPKWIENLSLLKTLILSECSRLRHLPNEVWNLRHLTQLDLRGCLSLTGIRRRENVDIPFFN